jgi:hypothetical protein
VVEAGTPTPATITPDITVNGSITTLTWAAAAGLNFTVQYADGIPASGPIVWITLNSPITYANGIYTCVDDGTQSGNLPFKIYRVVQGP